LSSTASAVNGGITSEALRGTLLTADADYTITKALVYQIGSTDAGSTVSGTQKFKVHAYANSAGNVPGALSYSTDELQLNQDNDVGWYHYTFTSPFDIDAGQSLHVQLHAGGPTSGVANIYYKDNQGANSTFRTDPYDNGPPNPYGTIEDQSLRHYLIWLEGTVREQPPDSGRLAIARRTDITRTVNVGAHLDLGGGGV
jgi:hypothetical protein